MRKLINVVAVLFLVLIASYSFAGVATSTPVNGATVSSPVRVTASATAVSGRTISSVIIYLDNTIAYTVYSNKVDTYLPVAAGAHTILIKSWDNAGAIYQQSLNVNVVNTASAITVTAPAAGATVGSPTRFVASAKSATAFPIASMMLFVDDVPVYTTYSNSMDVTKALAAGTRKITIKSWDNSGAIYQLPFTVNVGSATPVASGNSAANLDQVAGWESCDACAGAGGAGPSAPHSLTQGVVSPSLDGTSARFWMGGTTPYSDVLWWKKILTSSQLTQNRAQHSFVFDLYFYTDNPGAAQSIEWDVNQFVDGRSLIFGSQCSYRSKSTWDIWDNVNSHWISTGVVCPALQAYQWNHVVLEFERTSDNRIRYIAMTMNGTKHYLNWYYASTATTWSGVTVNYQMDGDFKQTNYSTWVDKMTLNYW
ncbi:MAG: hypothetical protein JWO13_2502 [Acidobacteriales bacterium]|nr:hypothetical protein [Terriglobales bacterium]